MFVFLFFRYVIFAERTYLQNLSVQLREVETSEQTIYSDIGGREIREFYLQKETADWTYRKLSEVVNVTYQ